MSQVIQGTNQSISHFDGIYQKLMDVLLNNEAELSPNMKRFIKSIECPHLNQLLEQKVIDEK